MGVDDRVTLRGALWVALIASLLMGVAIGVSSGEPGGYVFGAALAFANHLIGLCLGSGVRGVTAFVARGLRAAR